MPHRDMDQMTSMAVSLATPSDYCIRLLWLAAFISLELFQTATCNKLLSCLASSVCLVLAESKSAQMPQVTYKVVWRQEEVYHVI